MQKVLLHERKSYTKDTLTQFEMDTSRCRSIPI